MAELRKRKLIDIGLTKKKIMLSIFEKIYEYPLCYAYIIDQIY